MNAVTEQKICRLGILISGRGSNLAAIQQAIETGQMTNATIAVVVSNKPDAGGLRFAASKTIPTAVVTEKNDAAILSILQAHQIDLLVLAGYGRILSQVLLDAYPNRIVNIHPSLLPAYGGRGMVGIKVHQAVLAAKETESGCTVHGVTAYVDGGPILGQARVPVLPGDTAEILAERVLAEEHRLYPKVLQTLIQTSFIGVNSYA